MPYTPSLTKYVALVSSELGVRHVVCLAMTFRATVCVEHAKNRPVVLEVKRYRDDNYNYMKQTCMFYLPGSDIIVRSSKLEK